MIHSLLSYNESNTLDSFSQLQNARQGTGNVCDKVHRTLLILFEQKYNDPSADINTLAEEIHVSRRWLYEQTVRLTGKTPSEYLKCLRMNAAGPLLQSGKSLVEVSKSVGYAHTKTFTEAFKRHFGMPPGKWAKENPPPATIAPTCSNST